METEKQLDFSYDSALKNHYFAKWIKNLKISKEEYHENVDLFWAALQYLTKSNYRYEIIRNAFTGELVSKTTFIYNEKMVEKKWIDYFLLPEISFANVENFVKCYKENYAKFAKVLPLKQYKKTFKQLIDKHKLIYWKGDDSVLRCELFKAFSVIFARKANNVGFFNLSEIAHFVYANKLNLSQKLKNVQVLIIEFDLVNNFTNWFLTELTNILSARVTTGKLTFLGFDNDFYLKPNAKKIISLIKNYGFAEPIWTDLEKK
ncbi:hypothetical protein [Mesomycoplasma flocculare]|uniref:hypothetical protein n=1 Tax=Mesomycoplasma flocculare TaxID=2128 RepID=UPI00136F7296|nr:hypothetical protein [Mesomycoplasma flocculare]MXR22802.1 hypothetical protein [Mesomycoplasma flocculare]